MRHTLGALLCLALLWACELPVTQQLDSPLDPASKSYAGSPDKELTAFSFESLGTGTITGSDVAVTVPFGTDVTALKAAFVHSGAKISVGGVAQVSGVTANDFTKAVVYTVTAKDDSTKDFTVTVTIGPSSAKELTAFSFKKPAATATISGTEVAVSVPFGTDVTALKATFTSTGATVKVGTTAQVSDETANDFTKAVTYTVVAADGSTKDFTVTVTVSPSSANDITSFSFATPAATATITGTAIAVTVPYGTSRSALVATFATTGSTVKVGATVQVSGTTANDFSKAVTYTVTAADGTTKDFIVTVSIALNPAKDITAFSFTTPAATGTITGTAIAITVPFGTPKNKLVATFTTTGESVKVGTTTQVSGTTENDFTSAVTYNVTAADGTTQDYTVTVTVAQNSAKDITAFSFASPAATGTITGTDIAITVPSGTLKTGLVATFTTTGVSVKALNLTQTSGVTSNDFTAPVSYTVTAEDGTTKVYTVTVTAAPSSSKDITAFSFQQSSNAGSLLPLTVNGIFSGTTIYVVVPGATSTASLTASFSTTGASVKVGSTVQTSGTTSNVFLSNVTYTVTAGDGTTKDYTVIVTKSPVANWAVSRWSGNTNGDPGSFDGPSGSGAHRSPFGIAVNTSASAPSINLFVSDSENYTIRTLNSSGSTATLAGTPLSQGSTTDTYSPLFTRPTAMTFSTTTAPGSGPWVFLIDSNSMRSGQFVSGSWTWSTPLSGMFNGSEGIVADAAGEVYIADTNNHTIRWVHWTGTLWNNNFLAGKGTAGFSEGTGAAASFSSPKGVVLDSSGNLFVADSGNNRIRKVTTSGVVTTFAGTGASGNADGPSTQATFAALSGLAIDSSDNLYVSDGNSIRTISSQGFVMTIAGNPSVVGMINASGSGARFSTPKGLAVTGTGNSRKVYVADYGNNMVRLIQ